MKIELSQLTTGRNLRSCTRAIEPVTTRELSAFERRRSFEPELAATPDVRAAEVARGKALVADPNYPSRAQIKSIARTLAARCSGSDL